MIKKTITYTDYSGNQRTEDFYFNLNKAETIDMELSVDGGYSALIQRIGQSEDVREIVNLLKTLILKSYGEKTLDGKRFIKVGDDGVPLSKKFEETEAFVELYVELTSDANKAIEFVNAIIPNA